MVGVVLATILGTLVGIGRLSTNWLAARASPAVYVETLRDIPVLLQLFFWYGLLQALPAPRQAFNPSPRRVPVQPRHPVADAEIVAGPSLGARGLRGRAGRHPRLVARAADRRQDATGVRPPVWPVGVLLMVGLPHRCLGGARRAVHLGRAGAAGLQLQPAASTISPEYARAADRPGRSTPRPTSPRSCAPASWRCRRASGRPPARSGCVAARCCAGSSCRRRCG